MPSKNYPGLGLEGGWNAGEVGWGDPMNDNLFRLSVLTHLQVLSRVTSLPGSPADGAMYIVPSGDEEGFIAIYDLTAAEWIYEPPTVGAEAYVMDEAVFVYWSGTDWVTRPTGNSTVTTLTGNKTAVAGDFHGDKIFVMDTSGGDRTFTLPTGLVVTEPCTVIRGGSGKMTFVAAPGVTLRSADNIYTLRTTWSAAQVLPLGSNEYVLIGDLGS